MKQQKFKWPKAFLLSAELCCREKCKYHFVTILIYSVRPACYRSFFCYREKKEEVVFLFSANIFATSDESAAFRPIQIFLLKIFWIKTVKCQITLFVSVQITCTDYRVGSFTKEVWWDENLNMPKPSSWLIDQSIDRKINWWQLWELTITALHLKE